MSLVLELQKVVDSLYLLDFYQWLEFLEQFYLFDLITCSCLEPSDPDDGSCDLGGCLLEDCVNEVPGCADGELE